MPDRTCISSTVPGGGGPERLRAVRTAGASLALAGTVLLATGG
ncbi:hypothetical protein [Streptomyces sp. NPDC101150]